MKSGVLFIIFFLTVFSCRPQTKVVYSSENVIEAVKNPEVLLVDVRVPEQYEKETAKRAINIPLADIENNLNQFKNKKVVVFCNKGIQADAAVEILKKKGVEVYDGSTLKNIQAIQQLK